MDESSLFYPLNGQIFWLPVLAVVLDLLFADPARFPHPVQAVGFLADRMERFFRRFNDGLFGGTAAAALVVLHVWIGVGLLLRVPYLGLLAAVYLGWAGLALGSLLRDCSQALRAIEDGTLEEARHSVQMLVSRDTSQMSMPDLYRSLAESLSENFNDAFVAPFFWFLLGGPGGLWAYKAVSTLDSMWGYKTDRWLYFGRAAAIVDDLLAWLPARISILFLYLAALFSGRLPARGWFHKVRRDAGRMSSPNAGWPMAAAAWLCHGSMGGPTVYDDLVVNKPLLGPPESLWTSEKIRQMLGLVRLAGLTGALVMWAAALGMGLAANLSG